MRKNKMTDKQILKKCRKREKVLGAWMANHNYDAWDIYYNDEKRSKYIAVTKTPVENRHRSRINR